MLTTTAEGFFEKHGYKSIDRNSSPAAIQETVEFHPDLVFMDTGLTSDQIISANRDVVNNTPAGTKSIAANVEAVNAIVGQDYTGLTTTGITPRTMPDPASVFSSYAGTSINYAALPVSGPTAMLEDLVLSPASNPYGPVDSPNGVYVIDCQGQNLTIQRVRIVGTLIVLNPGSASISSPSASGTTRTVGSIGAYRS